PPRAPIGEEFPFMQEWTQGECLAVEEHVRQLSPEDRVLAHQLFDIAGRTCSVDPEQAVEVLDLIKKAPEERAELRRLALSGDDQERDVAKCLNKLRSQVSQEGLSSDMHAVKAAEAEAPASLELDGDLEVGFPYLLFGPMLRLANHMRELQSF